MISIQEVTSFSDEVLDAIKRLLPQLTEFKPIPAPSEVDEIINSQSSSIWVAKNEQEMIIGMCCLVVYRTVTGIHAWIEDVVVDKNARRQGIGRQLTQAVINAAQQKGAESINLTSRSGRIEANRLYQEIGFKAASTNLYQKKLTR